MSAAELHEKLRALPAESSPGRRVQAFEDWFHQACLEGEPPDQLRRYTKDEAERFWSYTIPGVDGHVYWDGPTSFMRNDGRARRPARWVWEHRHGANLSKQVYVRPSCGEKNCIVHLELTSKRDRAQLFSDSACIGALQVAAMKLGHPPQRTEYDERFQPSSSLLVQRFGSWEKALRSAGLDPDARPPAKRRTIPEETLIAALQACGRDTGAPPTSVSYPNWARGKTMPGQKTIERRFGSWQAAREAAGF